jgi:hypothetical protein
VLVVTDHDIIDWDGIIRSAKLLIDTRNVTGRFPALCAVAKIGRHSSMLQKADRHLNRTLALERKCTEDIR